MKSSSRHVAVAIMTDISTMQKQMICEHKWKKDGHGYTCQNPECQYYTGTNDELNGIIEKELRRKKR
ncbi:MAG TPA: hypothetical protein VJ327_10975 [Patescibacteria group bacterium]|nr:hypothetical protein [Patescibacteria group bacterium]